MKPQGFFVDGFSPRWESFLCQDLKVSFWPILEKPYPFIATIIKYIQSINPENRIHALLYRPIVTVHDLFDRDGMSSTHVPGGYACGIDCGTVS